MSNTHLFQCDISKSVFLEFESFWFSHLTAINCVIMHKYSFQVFFRVVMWCECVRVCLIKNTFFIKIQWPLVIHVKVRNNLLTFERFWELIWTTLINCVIMFDISAVLFNNSFKYHKTNSTSCHNCLCIRTRHLSNQNRAYMSVCSINIFRMMSD